jgi:predicted SnoaL-like aldol condensation-catalyzing enzyme
MSSITTSLASEGIFMKSAICSAIAALSLVSASALASGATDMKGAETPNGKVVRAFLDMEMAQHKPAEAFDKYVSKDYKNKYMGSATAIQDNNFAGQRAAEEKVFGGNSKITIEIKKMVAADDFVFVQALGKQDPNAKGGDQLWMLFRLKDGKIVEHWDIHSPNPENSDLELYY